MLKVEQWKPKEEEEKKTAWKDEEIRALYAV